MQVQRIQKTYILVGAIILVASFLLIYNIYFFKNQKPKQGIVVNKVSDKLEQVNIVGLPKRLRIPKISVDAFVEQVGLTPAGAMDTPKGPAEVAWFNQGKRPGEIGSSVITGHYGKWKNGQGSVFDNLHELQIGDKIIVEDENGVMINFVIREIRNFNPEADATDVFSSDDEISHLNLITCEGVWNKDSKSFSQRLIIFTDKENI